MGGRLNALAHVVRQKIEHLSVTAGPVVWGVDVVVWLALTEVLEGDECDDGCADRRAGAARTC